MDINPTAFRRTKYTCYFTYLAMSSVFCLPPMLFVTFREMYGISYTLLGTLVLINFCTQLTVDLIFTFFTRFFNIKKVIRTMPLLTTLGLIIYALVPTFLPQYAYVGLVVGTVVFSVAAGLSEVLLSPLVAAIPSKTPEKDMSLLHSLFAWGVVLVVAVSSVFLRFAGTKNWMYLTLFWAALPLVSFTLFNLSPIPAMDLTHSEKNRGGNSKRFSLALCTLCIFLGSAAENTMTSWISMYMENALHIPKSVCDILGLALYALLLGAGRTLYAKYNLNITNVLLSSMTGAAVCYLFAGVSAIPVLSALACVVTGLFTAMLWPGTLILMEEKVPAPGVTAYALMAAGGDFGGSVAPQLMGAVVDLVSASPWAVSLAGALSLSPEQVGMKTGMLIAALFPLAGIALLLYCKRYFSKRKDDPHAIG